VKVLFLCVWCFLSLLLLCPVLSVLSFIPSCVIVFLVCMLYVYGCFGEINYDDDDNMPKLRDVR